MIYDAILVVSYGGPNRPEDVLAFMRNATRGRGVPDERLIEVSGHYGLFGGKSPINERNAELVAALQAELHARGICVPVTIGNRNWHPFFAETLTDLRATGARKVLCVFTSAYTSYSGCRQYREDLARALEEIGGGLALDKIGPFAETEGFIRANTEALAQAMAQLPDAHVLFVTHSIPSAMNDASDGTLGTYAAQHQRVLGAIVDRLGVLKHELVYCSRSGAPHIPWLEPDVDARIAELAAAGVRRIITAPIGFLNDHMEVVYDLDTQARATAADHGVEYVRAATCGTHPALVSALVDAIERRALVASGEVEAIERDHYDCAGSCLAHPGAKAAPTI